jgi:tRNA nucleotidyltransferase (CCA-adding enzyme)
VELVVSHNHADFDALASQIAVNKLHPDVVRARIGKDSTPVRDFLALHKDHFELAPIQDVDLDAVSRLFLVDVRRASRLKPIDPLVRRIREGDSGLEVVIYDHHESAPDDLAGTREIVEPIGATTTLLVEELRRRELPVNPVEATLFALGIYSDTGSFTYPNTTPRDVAAAGFLISCGASLETLRYFLHLPLKPLQRQAMISMLGNTKAFKVNGVRVGIGVVEVDKAFSSLAEVVNDVLTLEGYELLFGVFAHGKHTTVIGRTQAPHVDVGSILQGLGGGGHAGAGSVRLRNTDHKEARRRLVKALRASPPKPSLVRHLMSTPVHTVDHKTLMQEASEDFLRFNISGAPVLKAGKIVGIISKRDIRDARPDQRRRLPVSSRMAQDVETIGSYEPILRAMERMVAEDIGRLPVLEDGKLVGIITRSDAMRVLYSREASQD